MNLHNIRIFAMLSICVMMFVVGAYMIYEGMIHEVGGDSESTAEIAILHYGHISGQVRIIIIAVGTFLVFSSAKFLWSANVGKSFKRKKSRFDQIKHYATKTGREIARLMRRKDSSI